jgi:pimeloyl-ACP methyl ester carboxylesterase
MDSRGQGRSTMSSTGISYDLMASDVIALLDYLGIQKTHLVGWSDGAIIGLNIAMKYSNRLNSLFAFAANYIPSGAKDISISPVFTAYLQRSQTEYESMNPLNDYPSLFNNMTLMWSTTPNWTQQDFGKIDQNLPVWIVDADHEEAIYREQPDTMTTWIPQSGELIIPRTSHFSFIQIPDSFTTYVTTFLNEANCFTCNYTASGRSSTTEIFSSLLLFCLFTPILFS